MKKHCFVFAFLFTCTTVLISCTEKPNENIYSNIHSIETKNYAIYASNLIESNPTKPNEYFHHERNINILFPQIYYSNEYNDYDMDLEILINKALFDISIEYNEQILTGRDTRELKEYSSDYTITKYDEDIFSIKYYGHLYSISHAREFCYGITINPNTGKIMQASDFISIDKSLLEKLEDGRIKIQSAPINDSAFVSEALSEFIEKYDTITDKDSLFFIDNDTVNLIIPVSYGSSSYIILEVPLGN